MEVIRGYQNILPRHHGCVVTIGNFDGVHRGHLQIIEHLRQQSRQHNVPMMLISFEPLPQEFFCSDQPKPRLSRLREKLYLLQQYKVDRVLILRFNAHLANMSAEDFIRQILVNALGMRYIVVGHDFRFGAKRSGDFALLERLGKELNYTVCSIEQVSDQGQRISSTMIRQALAQGQLAQAQQLLGHPYRMSGRVIHGDKRGRQIGVPTANIALHRRVSPISGVFAVRVYGIAAEPIDGVASVGSRPTISGGLPILLEVHLFHFNKDIYHRYVQVEFIDKLRDEKKYDSFEELKTQIFRDIEQAKAMLLTHST